MYRKNKQRTGQVSIVTIFAVLSLVVLVGLVGNVGHAVNEKLEVQHAADNTALSSAQWMARSMNSVTASNHLIGQSTALSVIHLSLGGPEADVGIESRIPQSDILDELNNTLMETAIIRGPSVPSPLTTADEKFLERVLQLVSPKDENHQVFATIYDSKLTLKKELAKYLLMKSVANLGFFVPPPIGYATAAISYGIHAYTTKKIVEIVKADLALMALEKVVLGTRNIKVSTIENRLVPELVNQTHVIAGKANTGAATGRLSSLQTGLTGSAILEELNLIRDAFSVEVATFPRPFSITLPLEPEPVPSMKGGPDEKEWEANTSKFEIDVELEDVIEKSNNTINDARGQLQNYGRDVSRLDDQLASIDRELQQEGITAEQTQSLQQERQVIQQLKSEKQARIIQETETIDETQRKQDAIVSSFNELKSIVGGGNGNLSETHLPTSMLDQKQERATQWVNATHPYVDAFRAPLLAQFDEHLEIAKTREHFVNWTNRYTLVKSWEFRSGYRFEKTSAKRGKWSKSPDQKPLAMLVMKGTYDRSGIARKGREPWTRSDVAGKEEAESLFTVVGLGHRELEPLFSPTVFALPHDRGLTTYAQAILYNANPQSPTVATGAGGPSNTQAKIGWDTLNWDPSFPTPSWGSEPSMGEAKWPWEIFSEARQTDSIQVKLNWQAKLMPTTRSRLQEATIEYVASDMNDTLVRTLVFFNKMSSH